jgi:hypothetical protein
MVDGGGVFCLRALLSSNRLLFEEILNQHKS